jgi:hypothetical protein
VSHHSIFIPRKYQNQDNQEIINFDTIVQNNISIILGEPASGKTYQLKNYNTTHLANTSLVELINIEDTGTVDEHIEIVLLDSIDEALIDYKNPKKLQSKLTSFIKASREKNPEVKIVITCRYLEWKEYFEEQLKVIDSDLKIYEVLPLDEEDINIILEKYSIETTRFWQYIKDNYLESLLKNIMIILHIVESFEKYHNQSVNYIEIYSDVVNKYITRKGSDREDIITDKPLKDIILIASSLATYMLFNREHEVLTSDLPNLANELYKVNAKNIIVDDLNIILNTALFEQNKGQFSFFHKSVQEYLVAHFIAYKNLDIDTLFKIFSNKIRFYDEFEEVIIYLTNIKPELFVNFIEFDPFIFKRHPSLNQEQQEKLLIALLDKLHNQKAMAWGKWDYFKNTTLVKFQKVDNLPELIQANVDIPTIDNLIFPYLMKLLEYNYSQKMEDLIFDILNNFSDDSNKIRNFIKNNFIDNFTFNSRLIIFMQEHDLFEKELHTFLNFETHLVQSLYGINFSYKETTVTPTGYDFNQLLSILDYIPHDQLKYIVPYINYEDCYKWYEYIKSEYDKSKYSSEYIAWVMHGVLNNIISYSNTKNVLIDIVEFLRKNNIYLHHVDKEKIRLNFNDISNDFWELYFVGYDVKELDRYETQQLLSFYDILKKDIEEASIIYSIDIYYEAYVYFNRMTEEIHTFLMANKIFKAHMENLWKQQKVMENNWKDKWDNSEHSLKRKQVEDTNFTIYSKSVKNINSRRDMYNIFNYLVAKDREEFIRLVKEELQDKYSTFIEFAKEEFIQDTSYLDLKKELTSNSLSNAPTFIFSYLFKMISVEERYTLLDSEEQYKKLFWHAYRHFGQMREDYFVDISKLYIKEFELLVIESIQLSLEQSNNKKIGNYQELKELFESLDIFKEEFLPLLVKYIFDIDISIFKSLEEYDRLFLLEILSLDITKYDFIKELMIKDQEHCYNYLNILIKMNSNIALSDFNEFIYKHLKRNIEWYVKACRCIKICKKPVVDDERYSENIYVDKIKTFCCLMSSLNKNQDKIVDLKPQYIKIILIDYYDFFKEYQHPTGSYSPCIHDDMNDLINKIWNHLEVTSNSVNILEELVKVENKRLVTRSEYTLEKAYNQQRKDRYIPNSEYKEIFDRNEVNNNGDTININISGTVHGAVVNNGNVTINKKLSKEEPL